MATTNDPALQSMEIVKEQQIVAPIAIVFETMLEQLGPLNRTPQGEIPMKLEAWPGGRWYRDLGDKAGHFWGVIQAIKAPSLLELHGPLFMSTPVLSNIQYRLTEKDGVTTLRFVHRAVGWILPEYLGIEAGWAELLARIQNAAEERV